MSLLVREKRALCWTFLQILMNICLKVVSLPCLRKASYPINGFHNRILFHLNKMSHAHFYPPPVLLRLKVLHLLPAKFVSGFEILEIAADGRPKNLFVWKLEKNSKNLV